MITRRSWTTANLVVTRPNDEKPEQGAARPDPALLANMIDGVTNGYKKRLEIQGVGYKAELKGKNLVLSVGFANQITMPIPAQRDRCTLEGSNKIHVTGADKQAVGQFAADVRKVRKPEPYKGKGIRYEGEASRSSPARRSPARVRSK